MKQARTLSMILIVMLICCSYSIGQSSSGIGVKGAISNGVPGILGTTNNGASVYPSGEVSNGATANLGGIKTGANVYPASQASNGAKIYLGKIKNDASILRLKFQCNLISSCGMYPYGKVDNGDGAKVYLGGVRSGATISGIDGSAVRMVSLAKAKS
jgi:hypothetical protein